MTAAPDAVPALIQAEMESHQATAKKDLVRVTIGAPRRVSPCTPMMLLFDQNLAGLLVDNRHSLTLTDLVVFVLQCQSAAFGNRITISQKEISGRSGIHKSEVSKSVTRLKAVGMIWQDDQGVYYISSVLVARAALSDLLDEGEFGWQMQESWEITHRIQGKIVTRPVKSGRKDPDVSQ